MKLVALDEALGAEPPYEDFRPPEFSDEALALRFAERMLSIFASSRRGENGCRGPAIIGDSTTRCTRSIWRATFAGKSRPGATRTRSPSAIASAKTVAAVDRLARADRRLAATVDQWDADPWCIQYAGRRRRSANRPTPSAQSRRPYDEDHRDRARAATARASSASSTGSPAATPN